MSFDLVKPAQPALLAVPSQEERAALNLLERTGDNHEIAMAGLACLQRLEAPPAFPAAQLEFPLRVGAWNLEQCYAVEATAAMLQAEALELVLLSEVDNGMARTGQRHTARDIADELGMAYAFGLEFLELDIGTAVHREFATDDFNRNGFHGNALLAGTSLITPVLVRLPDQLFWFNPNMPTGRVGTRCAVGAVVMTAAGPLYAVSVHLESRGDAAHRAVQMQALFDAVEAMSGGMPVIIAGDLNTGLANDGDFDAEPLFADARERGYQRHSGAMDQMTTRPSRISRNPKRAYKLDWLLTRGLEVSESHIVPSIAPDGEVLSDHDMVVATIAGFSIR